MNLTEQRAATRNLERPVVGLIPSHLKADVVQLCGFIPVAHYGNRPHVPGEVGSVEYVRYVVADVDELRYLAGPEAAAVLAL